jgi:hypothetical protein
MAGIVRCRGGRLLPGGLEGCYWLYYYMPDRKTTTYKLKHEAIKSSV